MGRGMASIIAKMQNKILYQFNQHYQKQEICIKNYLCFQNTIINFLKALILLKFKIYDKRIKYKKE